MLSLKEEAVIVSSFYIVLVKNLGACLYLIIYILLQETKSKGIWRI